MDAYTVATGKSSDGTRYLQLFLQEYVSVFNETVNPGCPKCLNTYLSRYKNHFNTMANTCNYRLHAKYENIPLEFGSPVLVNNANITDEYAEKLLQHKNGERYFAILPVAKKFPDVISALQEPVEQKSKPSGKRKKAIKTAGQKGISAEETKP